MESGDLRASAGVVRGALYNILGPQVFGASLVDLFAGAGSLGIEALSRGAARVTFVEVRADRAGLISANCEILGYKDQVQVVVGEAVGWIRRSAAVLLAAFVVLLDPPYLDPGPASGLQALSELGRLAESEAGWDPVVVFEHHRDLAVPEQAGALNCVRTARYGTSLLSFYRRSR